MKIFIFIIKANQHTIKVAPDKRGIEIPTHNNIRLPAVLIWPVFDMLKF